MSDRVPVKVYASDPISQAGISASLKTQPELRVVENGEANGHSVGVVVVDEVDGQALQTIRGLQRNGCPRVVLVVNKVEPNDLLAAVEAGIRGVVRRSGATPEALSGLVRSAITGDGVVPADLLGRLLDQVGKLQRQVLAPRGLTFTGLTEREVKVVRLVAEGLDTAEIAQRLSYSERTIKNVIHDVMMRLNLRNRSHTVAYALREGLI